MSRVSLQSKLQSEGSPFKSGATKLFAITLLSLAAAACTNDDAVNELPQPVYSFVNTYWPGVAIESYDNANGVQTVRIKDSATVYFNESDSWIRINGNGVPLPQILIYDQVPAELYTNLASVGVESDIYQIERTGTEYILDFENNTMTYNLR